MLSKYLYLLSLASLPVFLRKRAAPVAPSKPSVAPVEPSKPIEPSIPPVVAPVEPSTPPPVVVAPIEPPKGGPPPFVPEPEKTAEEKELVSKVKALVAKSYEGDTRKAFDAYAGPDGEIDEDELSALLSDADVGNALTRGFWVSGIISKLDKSGNGKISWSEFETVSK